MAETIPVRTTTPGHETALDRLNPATRVLTGMALSLPILLTLDWLSATTALALELVVALACGIRPGRLAHDLLPIVLVAPLGALSMALYGERTGRLWWTWGPMAVSDGSLRLALAMFIRVFALAVPALVLLRGLDATRMADGLAQVLHLPSRFVLGGLAGFRLLGLFADDWRTLGQARRARGLGDTGRVRRWATMCFALLVLAIRRGTRLATAMEAKGFGGPTPRSWARPSRVGGADALAWLVTALVGLVPLLVAHRFGTLVAAFS